MSDRKTIQFNPDLLKFTSNTTRKKRNKGDSNSSGIKIKSTPAKSKMDTLKKRSILKMIRQHQEDNYKKLLQDDKTAKPEKKETDSFISDFENSKEFLNKLIEDNSAKEKMNKLNSTIRKYPTQPQSLLYTNPIENVSLEFPNNVTEPIVNNASSQIQNVSSIMNPTQPNSYTHKPQYGCLKGGSLPTYRNWLMNKTQKNNPIIENITVSNPIQKSPIINPVQSPINTPINISTNDSMNTIKTPNQIVEENINKNMQRISEMKQTMEKLQLIKNKNQLKRLKQKKTIRRTYKIGKSKLLPKISVLVSNKTIRNNISTKSQLLKQVPIQDIKKYLIKRGLLKVGSTAPNDILRKMYESSILLCGEVQNHNPDYLLYNFMNGSDDK
jgi:hypothetical protein